MGDYQGTVWRTKKARKEKKSMKPKQRGLGCKGQPSERENTSRLTEERISGKMVMP